MRRRLDWRIVVPRVLLVIVALLAVQYVCGLAARTIAIRYGEASFGSQVDVGHARVSLADRQVVFSELSIGNSQDSTHNILQADRCELDFATGPLLHKQAVIEGGRISGLRVGAIAGGASAGNSSTAWFKDNAGLVVRDWLDSLGHQFRIDSVKQFESVESTDAFCKSWSSQSAALDVKLQELNGRAAELQRSVDAAQANPLRNDKLLENLPKKVADLQKEFATYQAEIDKLPDLLEKERRSIVAKRRNDEMASKRLRLEPPAAEALNAYLLREQAAKQLNEVLGLLRWVGESTLSGSQAGPRESRGTNILFSSDRLGPAVLIRSLQVEGSARIAGQPVELRGELTNLSSEPRLHDLPMRLRLVGAGSMPCEMQAMIDRTNGAARDELLIDCQGVLLPAVSLGRADQLEIQLAPSIASVSVKIVVEGGKLAGDIQMVQPQVQITSALRGSGSPALGRAVGETLGSVNSVATRLTLGGTLAEPTCALRSNLGATVAESLQRAAHRAGDEHSKSLLVEAGRRVDERLAEVDRQIAAKQSRFAAKSVDMTARLQKLALHESPRYRISAEKGGRRLPNNSLFR